MKTHTPWYFSARTVLHVCFRIAQNLSKNERTIRMETIKRMLINKQENYRMHHPNFY